MGPADSGPASRTSVARETRHLSSASTNVLIVIPAYNHTASIRDVVLRALTVHDRVLVIDDGTTEGSVSDALAGLAPPGVRLLRRPENRGKGTAILVASREARAMGMTHIITLDADGQHDPADIPRFLPVLQAHPEAIVVGRRDFRTANVPFASRFGRAFSNFWFRVQTGMPAGDTQCGFRAYPLAVLEALSLRETGFAFEVEVLVTAAWSGVDIQTVDISVHYPPAAERISHFRAVVDNVRLSILNTRLTLRSMLPWPHRRIGTAASARLPLSLAHPWRSVRVLLSETGCSPARLAAAGALGVFLGTVPLIACHTLVILVIAGYFGLNRAAAILTSQLCIPPLVPALCIETGYLLRHGDWLREISLRTLGYQGLERLWEWLLGSLLVGPVLAMAVGLVVYLMAVGAKAGLRAAE